MVHRASRRDRELDGDGAARRVGAEAEGAGGLGRREVQTHLKAAEGVRRPGEIGASMVPFSYLWETLSYVYRYEWDTPAVFSCGILSRRCAPPKAITLSGRHPLLEPSMNVVLWTRPCCLTDISRQYPK